MEIQFSFWEYYNTATNHAVASASLKMPIEAYKCDIFSANWIGACWSGKALVIFV